MFFSGRRGDIMIYNFLACGKFQSDIGPSVFCRFLIGSLAIISDILIFLYLIYPC
jgi:hypothetical protein